ncbi:nucleotidyltransferase family protein [Salinicola rhizosphaerae]|uniref:Nitrate reductase n=1 Tax=Salinicola rhizosphaerae TaxID=1443141 RepID=A0ABQ3ECM2_9GAMM|nr:nucleotidyltransferase family protein [Salinicola rhizosphaerae]GHB32184.1 nitrate reductase [Salinicola rhizosphaerae]
MGDNPTLEARLLGWVREDAERMTRLRQARELALPQWALAAGFVRNLVWDRLHAHDVPTPLNDIDLIFFDREDDSSARDRELTQRLQAHGGAPWSVKNQARMHCRHGHEPYRSTLDAMRFWVECETAVGVTLDERDRLRLLAPFGIETLMSGRVTLNPLHGDAEVLRRRALEKQWQTRWPALLMPARDFD